jgi:hypothetical protein
MPVSNANRPRHRRKHQATPTDHANFNEFLKANAEDLLKNADALILEAERIEAAK